MHEPFLVRLPMGEDLLEAIQREFEIRSISKGSFTVIGAVDRAVLGFYDPVDRIYRNREFPDPLEICACMGNVSIKDGAIFVHAHAVLAGADFQCLGGHLMPGTVIFASELSGSEVPGDALVRGFDEKTGLTLWV